MLTNLRPANSTILTPLGEEIKQPEAICYWRGNGNDYRWSNPLNWSTETIPNASDTVIFDGDYCLNLLLDIPAQIRCLKVTNTYTGTLSGWNDLVVLETVLIQGGTVEVNLVAGGDILIEQGRVNNRLSTQGNLTISGGKFIWQGGEIWGNFLLTDGEVYFPSQYHNHYTFQGNCLIKKGKVEGAAIFHFNGKKPQIFSTDTQEIHLIDFYNSGNLTIKGKVKVSSFFFNTGQLTIDSQSILNLESVNCLETTDPIIKKGKLMENFAAKINSKNKTTDSSNPRVNHPINLTPLTA